MARLVLFLAFVVAIATGFSWLADRPGDIVIEWEGYHIETNVFYAAIMLALLVLSALALWSLARHIWESPASVGNFFNRRRQARGLDALSSGMIAIGAGDRSAATRYAIQARKSLPNEPLTHLLRAQAAQLTGDKATSRRIFEAMLGAPDTEQLGLRGLYLAAEREGEQEAAVQFSERAVRLNPKLEWAVTALFGLQCRRENWSGALETLSIAKRHGHFERTTLDRRRAVLLAAQAQNAEDSDPETALTLSLEAHGLAQDLVPAAVIAGRLLASRGNTPRAAKVIQKTWQKSPHPDLAVVYAYARLGDSPHDRLERVKKLATANPHSLESPIALAVAAIEAKEFETARQTLEPLLDSRLTQRTCKLMAQIESEQHGNKGRVREWLARAVNAPRDPAWTADGIVSDRWAPVSPATGTLDAFQWRVPVEDMESGDGSILTREFEDTVALGGPLGIAASEASADEEEEEELSVNGDVVSAKAEAEAAVEVDKKMKPSLSAEIGSPPVRADDVPADLAGVKSSEVSEPSPVPTTSAAVSQKGSANVGDGRETGEPGPVRRADVKPIKTHKPQTLPTDTPPTPAPRRGAAADEKTSGKRTEARKKRRKGGKNKPKIFVSPRAPDDPGPRSSSDVGGNKAPINNPYRTRTP